MNKLLAPLALALVSPVLAQQGEVLPGSTPDLAALFGQWRSAHGAQWHLWMDPATRHAEMLYGGSASAPGLAGPRTDADWFALARVWVQENSAFLGVDSGELRDLRTVFLPLGTGNGSDKQTVRLEQWLGDLRVENGAVNALFDLQGSLLSLHNTTSPWTETLVTSPTIDQYFAVKTAAELFFDEHGVRHTEAHQPELFVAQVTQGAIRRPYLAWKISLYSSPAGPDPIGISYILDAHSAQVLRRDAEVHHFDVTGQVRTMASPGTAADSAGNPPQSLEAPYIRVSSSAGTVLADRNGNFTFPGVNTPLNITVQYLGQYNNANNQAGADYSVTFPNVQPNQANTLLMNPNPSQFTTAQANGYKQVNTVGDYIRDTVPGDTTANFVATTNVNINDTCNAYYSGSGGGSINFYRSGGSCNNTAFSTIVGHEFGHWLNVRYGTGNGQDGMGEGNADVWSMYTYDTPTVGAGFFTNGGAIRTGNNTRQFCGNNNNGCYGQVHADGEVWMGAAWKVRNNLNSSLGNNLGDQTADNLFVGWMNAYNQQQILSIIEIQWLTLDDNDGNINNGTPNYDAINNGFLAQGFPGFELTFVDITNVTQIADQPADLGPYTVDADLLAVFHPPVANATLLWRLNGGAWIQSPMTASGPVPNFAGQITTSGSDLGVVEYYVRAADVQGNVNEFPAEGASDPLVFSIGEMVLMTFDFEATTNEGWGLGTPNNATTGIWTRNDPNPTAAQSGNDHTPNGTRCWFTGQGTLGGSLGENDVDGGTTSLITPIWDLSTVNLPRVTYWRWYSNNTGAAPNSDVFQVDVSNDGGNTWVTAETVGPGGPQTGGNWFQSAVDIAAFVTPTATTRLRFRASDLGSGSLVEAMLDDIEVIGFGEQCIPPISYCTSTPNSASLGAVIQSSGSQNVNDNNFQLSVGGAVPNQFGLFYYGDMQDNTPVGNGIRCVSGQVFRLPPVPTDFIGSAYSQVDFSSPPAAAGQIVNGSTWNFSFWYRDPNVGAGYNFSNGIQVEFCD